MVCPIHRPHYVEKEMTPIYKYRHEYESIGLTLITVLCDAMYGVMPPLGGGPLYVF
jgi:hypothetical protein